MREAHNLRRILMSRVLVELFVGGMFDITPGPGGWQEAQTNTNNCGNRGKQMGASRTLC